jgi:chorismate mutase-like protein
MNGNQKDEFLLRIGTKLPPVPADPNREDIDPWRDRIDEIDSAIIRLLNERAECAIAIGSIKRLLGIPIYVPSREEAVLGNVTESNPGPLSDTAVRRLYERIIDETRSLERQLSEERHGAEGN